MADRLTPAQCTLLAVSYASDGRLAPLLELCRLQNAQNLPTELILRILLTYLAETIAPPLYTPLIQYLISNRTATTIEGHELDISGVRSISPNLAERKVQRLDLLPLSSPTYSSSDPDDILPRFIIHRSQRIDSETGLLVFIPQLVAPFIQQSTYLRNWLISCVLPLVRLQHEYCLDSEPSTSLSLVSFGKLNGLNGINVLLSGSKTGNQDGTSQKEASGTIGGDLQKLVGPWMYGHSTAKRRKLNDPEPDGNSEEDHKQECTRSWYDVNNWLVKKAGEDFHLVTTAIEQWSGPKDVDLGGYAAHDETITKDELQEFQTRYAQASFAACYAVQENNDEAISGAHSILTRLADLLDFDPPPDLATSVDQLPRADEHTGMGPGNDGDLTAINSHNLLNEDNPLTRPTMAAYMMLQMLVYSAYQFAALGQRMSTVNVVRLRCHADEQEQLRLLRSILFGVEIKGKRSENEWRDKRNKLIWLWGWNIKQANGSSVTGAGPLGGVPKDILEKEYITLLLRNEAYAIVKKLYIDEADGKYELFQKQLEKTVLDEALRFYDNASNGNKTRGSMKQANDMLIYFRTAFPKSPEIVKALALISATHRMSFYSLTLQHGVPFKPVAIRASSDPISMIEQILEQNTASYTRLDDLIGIAESLAASGNDNNDEKKDIKSAEKRVIFMCITSALSASDFDTAYSYLINRLNPDTINEAETFHPFNKEQIDKHDESNIDDISWRAAFLAGRFRSSKTLTTSTSLNEQIRRLEQRTELLSLALTLAPSSALTQILSVYRSCEEELAACVSRRTAADLKHDELAIDQTSSTTTRPGQMILPGGFESTKQDILGFDTGRVIHQARREVGRFVGLNPVSFLSGAPRPSSSSSLSSSLSSSSPGNTNSTSQSKRPLNSIVSRASDALRSSSYSGAIGRSQPSHTPNNTIQEQKVAQDDDGNTERPVGLFDLASGAAAALRRSAFPLSKFGSAVESRDGSRSSSRQEHLDQTSLTIPPVHTDDHRVNRQVDVEDMDTSAWGDETEDDHTITKPKEGDSRDNKKISLGNEGVEDESTAWGWDDGNPASPKVGNDITSHGNGLSEGGNVEEFSAWDDDDDGTSHDNRQDFNHGDGDEGPENRVRTRDVLSNVVTGGLAKGVGWMLGATPVDR